KLQLTLLTGPQEDNLNWSIAGNTSGQSPNVLSELKWQNVKGTNYAAALQINVCRNIVVLGGYNRVAVKSGNVSDIDYSADNRSQPTYNKNFSDNKGYTSAWYAGVGYIIYNDQRFSLVPSAGYSNNTQSLYITDATGQFPTLNSFYNVQWAGAFIKLKSSVKIWRELKAVADVTYNQVNYSGQGNWNLINEFMHPVSYRHTAKGYGINAGANLVYKLTSNIAVSIGYTYFNWQTGNGTDQLYLSSGQVDKTQLNGVYRNGHLLSGGVVLSLDK
ncbi:MAG: hypothetical protein ABIN13_12580, partial [Mucilaginibacter sp.]